MSDDKRNLVLRAIPSAILLATGIFVGLAAIGFIGYGFVQLGSGTDTTGNGLRTIAFGVGLIAAAVVIIVTSVGVWRSRPAAVRVGMALVAVATGLCLLTVPRALNPLIIRHDPATGSATPVYDTGAMLIVLAAVPYLIALACLVVTEFRQHRPAAGSTANPARM